MRQLKGGARRGQYHTKSYRSYRTNTDLKKTQQPGTQGCKNKLRRNCCGVYFCVSFLTLKVGQLTEKV